MYVAVAEQANLPDSLADACSVVGIMHNTMVNSVTAYCESVYIVVVFLFCFL